MSLKGFSLVEAGENLPVSYCDVASESYANYYNWHYYFTLILTFLILIQKFPLKRHKRCYNIPSVTF